MTFQEVFNTIAKESNSMNCETSFKELKKEGYNTTKLYSAKKDCYYLKVVKSNKFILVLYNIQDESKPFSIEVNPMEKEGQTLWFGTAWN